MYPFNHAMKHDTPIFLERMTEPVQIIRQYFNESESYLISAQASQTW